MTQPEKLPPATPAPISAILIARNQKAGLAEQVDSWAGYLDGLGWGYELLLVDDGSTDGTAALAETLGARHAHLRFLRHPVRRGFGAALRTGLGAARQPLLLYTGADYACRADELKAAWKWLDEVHLVAGHRVGETGPYRRPFSDRWARWLARWVFGVRLRDVGCLFLVGRRSVFARIPVQSDGPFAHAEVLAKANFLGAIMTEVPLTCPSGGGSSLEGFRLRQTLAEAHRLFHHPDFGPPVVPEAASPLAGDASNAAPPS